MSPRTRRIIVIVAVTLWTALLLFLFATNAFSLTKPERLIVLRMKGDLDAAINERASAKAEVEQAQSEAKSARDAAGLAASSAATTAAKAKTAEDAALKEHNELARCATENASNRELIKAVTGPWWCPGLNALIYGLKKSTLSLLVIIAIVVVIGILLKVFAPGVVAGIGLGYRAAVAFIKRLIPKPKP